MERRQFLGIVRKSKLNTAAWRRGWRLLLLAGMFFVLGLGPLFAQFNVGSIVGTVTDTSGASISGATVTLINPATAEKQAVQTNGAGDYVFNSLRPAVYNLQVEFKGFATVLRENVILNVAERIKVDFSLQPGAVTQTVEVRSESPLLQPETSSISSVIAERTILDLPLEGRNVYELVRLVPGTTPQYDYGGHGDKQTSNFALSGGPGIGLNEISINGGRNLTNDFLLDDVPDTTMGYNGVAIVPPLDAVQEFNVLTNAMPAKYGRTGGGLITTVTKSGTNAFHGTVWEFLRNDELDANFFFNNATGQDLGEFKQNQFGATAGGPVFRNKTFFFGSYEGFRLERSSPLLLTVPTALMKQGDLSQIGVNLYNPFTTRPNPATGGYLRDQFMGCGGTTPNVICPSLFDPVSAKVLQYFPDQNLPGTVNNYIAQAGNNLSSDAWSVRIDHNFSERHRLFGRFSWDRQHLVGAKAIPNAADFNSNPFSNQHRGLTLSFTDSLSPSSILNVRYGLLRETQLNNSGSAGFDPTKLGFPASLVSQYETLMFPRFDVSGFTSLGTQYFTLVNRANTTQSLAANFSKVIGRHSIEVGTDLRLIQGALYQPGWPAGQFQFYGGYTNGPDPTAGLGNGNAFADFLLGATGTGYASYDAHWFFTNRYYAFYVQDDIKVSRKLTLNLGLRYDYESPLEDRYNQLSFVDFQHNIPLTLNPTTTAQLAATDPNLVPKPPFVGGVAFPGVGGLGKGVTVPVRSNFAPRLGLAYSATSKLVIRAGYGIIYPGSTADNSGNYPTIQGFNPITTDSAAPVDGLTPSSDPSRPYLLGNPFPNGLSPVVGSKLGLLTSLGNSNTGFARHDPHAYYQQWNFGVQRELPGNLLIDASYVGAQGVHVLDFTFPGYNGLPDKYLSLGDSLYNPLPNPFFGEVPNTSTIGCCNTVTRMQLLKPFPYFTTVVHQGFHRTSTSYNAFELKVQKRMSHGLGLLLSYTASKALDDDSSTNGGFAYLGANHQNPNNLRLDRSLNTNDRSQILVLSSIYELPFGRGKPFGSAVNPVLRQLIGGWEVSTILSFATGFPLPISCGGGVCQFPAIRPNLVGDPSQGTSGSNESRLNHWFNTDAFAIPTPFTYGNTPRDLPHTRGPGQANTDLSLVKNTRFGENYNVQFRAEFFNALNRPEFFIPGVAFYGSPAANLANNFGVITSQQNLPREIQFGLKFYW